MSSTSAPSEPQLTCPLTCELGPSDVLLGRGTGPNEHKGNRRFRELVREEMARHLGKGGRTTNELARHIVQVIQERGGRFVRKETQSTKSCKTGVRYVLVSDALAIEKTRQAFRFQRRTNEAPPSSRRLPPKSARVKPPSTESIARSIALSSIDEHNARWNRLSLPSPGSIRSELELLLPRHSQSPSILQTLEPPLTRSLSTFLDLNSLIQKQEIYNHMALSLLNNPTTLIPPMSQARYDNTNQSLSSAAAAVLAARITQRFPIGFSSLASPTPNRSNKTPCLPPSSSKGPYTTAKPDDRGSRS